MTNIRKNMNDIYISLELKFIWKEFIHMASMNDLVNLYKIEQEIQITKLQGNYQHLLNLYSQIIKMKSKFPNRLGLAKSISEKAFLLEQLGYRKEAINQYHFAKQVAHGTPNKDFIHVIENRIDKIKDFQK